MPALYICFGGAGRRARSIELRIIKNNGYLCLQGIDGRSFFGKNTGVSPAAEEIFMTFFAEYAIINIYC